MPDDTYNYNIVLLREGACQLALVERNDAPNLSKSGKSRCLSRGRWRQRPQPDPAYLPRRLHHSFGHAIGILYQHVTTSAGCRSASYQPPVVRTNLPAHQAVGRPRPLVGEHACTEIGSLISQAWGLTGKKAMPRKPFASMLVSGTLKNLLKPSARFRHRSRNRRSASQVPW